MRGTREGRTPVDPGRTAGEGRASGAESAGEERERTSGTPCQVQ